MADGPLPAVDAPRAPGGELHGPLKRVTLGRSRGGLPPIPFPVGGRDGGRRLTRPVRRRTPQEAQRPPQTRVVVNTPPAPAQAPSAPSGEPTGPSKASQTREAFYRAINQPDAEYFRGQPVEVTERAHTAARGLVGELHKRALSGQLQAMDDLLQESRGKPKRTVRPRSSYRRRMPAAGPRVKQTAAAAGEAGKELTSAEFDAIRDAWIAAHPEPAANTPEHRQWVQDLVNDLAHLEPSKEVSAEDQRRREELARANEEYNRTHDPRNKQIGG